MPCRWHSNADYRVAFELGSHSREMHHHHIEWLRFADVPRRSSPRLGRLLVREFEFNGFNIRCAGHHFGGVRQ